MKRDLWEGLGFVLMFLAAVAIDWLNSRKCDPAHRPAARARSGPAAGVEVSFGNNKKG